MATVAALAAGVAVLAAWMAVLAALAAVQLARSRRIRGEGEGAMSNPGTAGAAAAAVVVGAAFGPAGVLGGVLVAAALGAATARVDAGSLRRFALVVAPPAVAAASLVLTDRLEGAVPAFVVLALASAYDAGAYLVGTGANNAWEGIAAGVAAEAAVTLAAAAVFSPPLRGAGAWVLGAVALVAAPAGPRVASALIGDREARVPAVRRLDSLLILGPAGLAVTAVFVKA
ncbi:MAG TPA: hypothetical protein VFA94_11860 [Acidimicrobiales bacterium]|nr:hypothetical protein [Acidimicrobiales bacterium]